MTPPRFLADAMLGRLARWLRVIGCDTLHLPVDTPDAVLVRRAHDEGRILLTRDRHLLRELRPARAMEILSEVPLEQLRQVVTVCALGPPAALLCRCLLCNTELTTVAPDAVLDQLPPSARALPGPVRCCPTCGRVYWRGSHARRMQAALDAALPGWLSSG